MADRDPAWLPILAGAAVITGWTVILGIVAGAVLLLTDVNRSGVAVVVALLWWFGFKPIVQRVRDDLRGGDDEQ